uniref:Ribosomal protein L5 n=1 Tax=Malawimonas californiana TaxID=221722 RepID=A0A0B5GNM8_MALCL|nr:ribosomal protein L5 [Malawimonas californiana]AJF22869.1 ribosomal protein L5 [Malawimonas californiana]
MNNLKNYFNYNIRPNMILKLNNKNIMEIPKMNKVILNIGFSNVNKNKNNLLEPMLALELISSQKSKLIKAKKSISTFNLRQGVYTACKVTLCKNNLYDFITRINKTVFPNIQEFKGLPINSFDLQGNYSFSVDNLIIFPEIEFLHELFNKKIGMNVTMNINSKDKKNSIILLSGLQMPFSQPKNEIFTNKRQ